MEGISDIEYLQSVEHGDHDGLVARAVVRYTDIPGHGFYRLTCAKCGSTLTDPWTGEKFDETHVVQYALAWKNATPLNCKEALRLNQVRLIMEM